MNTFYTSDLHLSHRNIVKFTKRPVSAEEHDQWIIDLWNSQVNPGDLVYHLGDFCFAGSGKKMDVLHITEQLNGNIVFIKGNHDNDNVMECIQALRLKGRTEVYDYKEIHINGVRTVLSHYPFVVWNNSHHGGYHLYGHCHSRYTHPGKALDVGLDNAYKLFGEHRFFTNEDVIEYMKGREVYAPDHHTVMEK
jgi:calcineurin-like phosphoesterase family protein